MVSPWCRGYWLSFWISIAKQYTGTVYSNMDMQKTIESITELLIGKKSVPTKKIAKAKPKRKTAKRRGK